MSNETILELTGLPSDIRGGELDPVRKHELSVRPRGTTLGIGGFGGV